MRVSGEDVNAIVFMPHQTCIDLMNYLNCHRQRNNRSEITRQVWNSTFSSDAKYEINFPQLTDLSYSKKIQSRAKIYPRTNAISTLRKAQLIHSDFERRCAFGRVIANDIHLTGFRNLR